MSPKDETPAVPLEPRFRHAVEFFELYLSKIWRRDTLGSGTWKWCEQWWKHPEAYVRIEMLWRSWEATVVRDPNEGLANWMVHTCDPMMRELLSREGTFKECVETHKERSEKDDRLPFLTCPFYA